MQDFEDNECFRWCLIKLLNPVSKTLAIITKVDQKYVE